MKELAEIVEILTEKFELDKDSTYTTSNEIFSYYCTLTGFAFHDLEIYVSITLTKEHGGKELIEIRPLTDLPEELKEEILNIDPKATVIICS